MSDEDRRRKKRENVALMAAGETPDLERAQVEAKRYGEDAYASLLGMWVLGVGVREHIRGRLDAVQYFPGGARLIFQDGIFHLANFDQEKPSLDEGEQRLQGPTVVQESAMLWLSPQPKKWPQTYS